MAEGGAYTPIIWTTLKQQAIRLNCSVRHLQRRARAGRLKTVRINDRGDERTTDQWVDEMLLADQRVQQAGEAA